MLQRNLFTRNHFLECVIYPAARQTRSFRPSLLWHMQLGDIFERYHIEMQRNNIILQFNEYGN